MSTIKNITIIGHQPGYIKGMTVDISRLGIPVPEKISLAIKEENIVLYFKGEDSVRATQFRPRKQMGIAAIEDLLGIKMTDWIKKEGFTYTERDFTSRTTTIFEKNVPTKEKALLLMTELGILSKEDPSTFVSIYAFQSMYAAYEKKRTK